MQQNHEKKTGNSGSTRLEVLESILSELPEIQEMVQHLEVLKDRIIHFWNTYPRIEGRIRDAWISDIREFYYSTHGACEMLSSAIQAALEYYRQHPEKNISISGEKSIPDRTGFANSGRELLSRSNCMYSTVKNQLASVSRVELSCEKERLKKSSTEKKHRRSKTPGEEALRCLEAEDLLDELENTFEKLSFRLSTLLGTFFEKRVSSRTFARTVRTGDREYIMPCAVCGETAVKVSVRIPETMKTGGEKIIVNGIVRGYWLPLSESDRIFRLLEEGNLRAFHEFLKKQICEGLDAYCPDCDRIYCRTHYRTKEEWDEGFYDYTEGTCPKGHTRVIDD